MVISSGEQEIENAFEIKETKVDDVNLADCLSDMDEIEDEVLIEEIHLEKNDTSESNLIRLPLEIVEGS